MCSEDVIKNEDGLKQGNQIIEEGDRADNLVNDICNNDSDRIEADIVRSKQSFFKRTLSILKLNQSGCPVTKAETVVIFIVMFSLIIASTITVLLNMFDMVDGLSNKINTMSDRIYELNYQIEELQNKLDEISDNNVVKQTPFFGVGFKQENDGSDNPIGITVDVVYDNSPAATAGVAVGDVILSVNGNKIEVLNDIIFVISECKVGATINVELAKVVDGKIDYVTIAATLVDKESFGLD